MREQLLVLTGGPGTGKTYTVKQIVEGWRRRGKRVVLACPTARAATVLAATVTPHPKPQNRPRPTTPLRPPLSPRPRPCPCPRPSWLEQVGSPASTIHRLLEYNPQEDEYKRNQLRPLEADAIVVDELSPLDADAIVVDEAARLDLKP
eukprot:scaffold33053_cov28-Phaeocystis_antarctica.AAC.1